MASFSVQVQILLHITIPPQGPHIGKFPISYVYVVIRSEYSIQENVIQFMKGHVIYRIITRFSGKNKNLREYFVASIGGAY